MHDQVREVHTNPLSLKPPFSVSILLKLHPGSTAGAVFFCWHLVQFLSFQSPCPSPTTSGLSQNSWGAWWAEEWPQHVHILPWSPVCWGREAWWLLVSPEPTRPSSGRFLGARASGSHLDCGNGLTLVSQQMRLIWSDCWWLKGCWGDRRWDCSPGCKGEGSRGWSFVLAPGQEGDPSGCHGTEVVTATHSAPQPPWQSFTAGSRGFPASGRDASWAGRCVLLREHVGASSCWCPTPSVRAGIPSHNGLSLLSKIPHS